MFSSEASTLLDNKNWCVKNQLSPLQTMDILTIPDRATHLLIVNCNSNADAITIRNHINGKTFMLEDDTPLKWTHLQDNTYFTTSRLADNFIKLDTQTILRKTQVSFSCIIQRILLRATIGKVQK